MQKSTRKAYHLIVVITIFVSFTSELLAQDGHRKIIVLNSLNDRLHSKTRIELLRDTVGKIFNYEVDLSKFDQHLELTKSKNDLTILETAVDTFNLYSAKGNPEIFFSNSSFNQFVLNIQAESQIWIENCAFHNTMDFSGTSFNKFSVFLNDTIYGRGDFHFCTFRNSVTLQNSKFKGGLDFTGSSFYDTLDFAGASLLGKLNMTNVKLSEAAFFNFFNTELPDSIILTLTNSIPLLIDFTTANFSDRRRTPDGEYRPHQINLYGTDIAKIKIDYKHFKLMFPDSIEILKSPLFLLSLEEKKIAISDDDKASVYEALLNNFKLNGQMESYKLLDIEYQTWQLERGAFKYFVWLPKYWWNFGYNKERVVIWTLLLVVFFSSINLFFINFSGKDNNLYKLEFEPKERPSIVWKFWYSLLFTSTVFFRVPLKIDRLNLQNIWGSLYLILVSITGLVCMAYLANFIIRPYA